MSETVFFAPADRRALVLPGMPADREYTFEVRAYRKVDGDVDPDGVILSPAVTADPYQPSTGIAFKGDITGTIQGRDTLQVVLNLENIASDNVLSTAEKPALIIAYNAAYANWQALRTKANSLNIAQTQRAAADTAHTALLDHLSALTPAWNNTTVHTPIVKATFQAKFDDFHVKVADLQAAIQGQKGADGTNGTSPPLVTLDATKTVAAYDKNNAYLGGGITFTAARQNTTATIYWEIYRVSDGAGIYGGYASDFYGNYPTYFSATSHDVLNMTAAGVAAYINAYGAFRVVASAYGQPASDSVTINKVKDGADGANGAPGGPGADGTSSYVHHAYADNITGTVNFTTGDPGGRAFQGVYIDNVAADSTDPASYAWSAYTGPASFGLYPAANVVVGPDFVHKSSGAAGWNASAYSTEAFVGGCSASFVAGNDNVMFGINTDPATNNNFDSIDYALYLAPGGSLDRYESNSGVAIGTWAVGDTIQIHYDGKAVRYYKNGTVLDTRTAAHGVPQGARFFLDTSIYSVGSRIEKIKWNAAGQSGADGAAGVSPVSLSIAPATRTLKTSSAGVALSGELPLTYAITAQKAGSPVTITDITITSSSGGTWSDSANVIEMTALSGGATSGEASFTATADGQTVAGKVTFSTSAEAAAVNQTSRGFTPTNGEATGTSYSGTSNMVVTASPTGTLSVNLTGSLKPTGSNTALEYQYVTKLQYSLNGGSSWTDVSGSERTSETAVDSSANEPGVPEQWSNAGVNSAGPYALSGLGANAAVTLRFQIKRGTYAGSVTGITGVLTIYAGI